MILYGDRIFTIRLLLRRVQEKDLGLLAGWSTSRTAHGEYLTPEGISHTDMQEQLRLGALWSEHNKTFLIERKDGQPIGTIHYWLRPENNDTAVIALKIAEPQERGKGYGTETQKYLISFLFDRLAIQYVEMYTDINNTPQQRCLKKLGFDLVDSLSYIDHQVQRTGNLYRLEKMQYKENLIYQHHYA